MEKIKFSKSNMLKKILSITAKILYDILIFFCIVLIAVVVWQRITDSNQSINGYRLFRIISGSMVPEYNIDEVVVCKDIDAMDLKIGDIIVYRGRIGELNNKLVMHEIININNDNGELTFHVKGIQNILGDPNVSANQILGKVIFKSSILTHLYALATNVYSSFIIIFILVINVFISFKPTRQETPKLAESIEDDNKKENNNKDTENDMDSETNSTKDIFDKIDELEEHDETEKLQAENKKLQEENKLLKEKVESLNNKKKKSKEKK